MPQILCVACFIALFQLDGSNALLVILISDYDLLLEKTIGWFSLIKLLCSVSCNN